MAATAGITIENGCFNRIRQVAPVCASSNTWFLGDTSQQPKRHLHRLSFSTQTHRHTDHVTSRLAYELLASITALLAMLAKNERKAVALAIQKLFFSRFTSIYSALEAVRLRAI